MKLTEKDGLFSFMATNQDEEILLNKIKECIEFGEPIPIEVLGEYNEWCYVPFFIHEFNLQI
jgi:hypothetical protein